MASFVHLAPESLVAAIKRRGIASARFTKGLQPSRGIFCFPVLPDFFHSHQWLHELRRRSREKVCGVYFRIPDAQTVYLGHYGQQHEEMTAADAVARLRENTPLGMEVIVPRAVTRGEILRIKHLPQITGWRFYPEAKGTEAVWPLPGTFGAKRLRKRITDKNNPDEAHYFSRFPAEWYAEE